jgi:hypothetical protein
MIVRMRGVFSASSSIFKEKIMARNEPNFRDKTKPGSMAYVLLQLAEAQDRTGNWLKYLPNDNAREILIGGKGIRNYDDYLVLVYDAILSYGLADGGLTRAIRDAQQMAKILAEVEPGSKAGRFAQAYLRMVLRVRYRPAAPSDGCGNIIEDPVTMTCSVKPPSTPPSSAPKKTRTSSGLASATIRLTGLSSGPSKLLAASLVVTTKRPSSYSRWPSRTFEIP